jgi:hypothetical protein
MKSTRKRRVEHVAHMRMKRNAYSVFVDKCEEKNPPGRPRLHGRILLKWISK